MATPKSDMRTAFYDPAQMVDRLQRPLCRVCQQVPDKIFVERDCNTFSIFMGLRCHGDRETLKLGSEDELFYGASSETDRYRQFFAKWPHLCFDRYTMIPLEPTFGFDD